MGQVKTPMFLLALVIVAIALAGCTSSNSSSPTTSAGNTQVVVTYGDPTPRPAETPTPTPGPTWTPTPTPVPLALSMTKFTLTGAINPDQRTVINDPNYSLELNAQYAVRQDTATFTIQNTGSADLSNLNIQYEVDEPETVMQSLSSSSTRILWHTTGYTVGTLRQGESRDISMKSYLYHAMSEINMSITAKWDGGSLLLYTAKLEPDLSGGVSVTDARSVMSYGSSGT